MIESPYRALIQPLLSYIDRVDERDPRPVAVVLAELVPRHWWEFILHSQTAFRLRAALLFRPNTIVIDVPYHHGMDLEAFGTPRDAVRPDDDEPHGTSRASA